MINLLQTNQKIKKTSIFLMLMVLFAPMAMNGQTTNRLLSQNFDGTGLVLYDNTYDARGWYTYNAGDGNNWDLYQAGSGYAHSGSYVMTYAYNSTYDANCYLVSEPFNVNADMIELSVSLYEKIANSSYPETFEVFFIKASDVTTLTAVASATHYGAIASASYTNDSDYAQVSGSNTSSDLAGQSVRVVVHCTSEADMYRLYIDDITVTETIAEPCLKPTGLVASKVTTNSTILNWNGDAESYNVRYRIVADVSFSDDFENDLSNWTIVDADGDGFNWTSHINTGTGNHTAHSGDGVACSKSYDNDGGVALTPDNWLITPQIQLGGSVSFWAMGQDPSFPAEHFAIYVSTTGKNPSDFTQISEEYIATGEYLKYSASLSDYSGMGYVAIRHFNVSDQFILNIDDFEIYGSYDWVTVNNVNGNSLTINSLSADTDYEFQVQASCGTDGESSWPTSVTFHTLDYCDVPYELSVTNITAGSATLNWTGGQATYNVRYRELVYCDEVTATEDFSDYTPLCYNGGTPIVGINLPSDWIFQSDNSNYPPRVCNNDGCIWVPENMANQGNYLYMTGGNNLAVMPRIENLSSLSFKYAYEGEGHGTLEIGYFDNNTFYQFNDITTNTTTSLHTINLTPDDIYTLNSTNGARLAFSWYNNTNWAVGIDDIVYTYAPIITGEWVNKTNVESPLAITGLSPITDYEWQVQGINCDGNHTNTEWSDLNNFTTRAEKHFATEGSWNVADNWEPEGLPVEGEDVIIDAAATIPSGYLANVGHVTVGTNGAITIADGGQLRHTNGFGDDVTVTLEKVINGYGTSTERDHYYFIAPAPFNRTISPTDVTNMLANDYDLYYFDAAAPDGLEWINQESNSNFKLRSAHGYLYANSETVTLRSTGPTISSVSSASIQVNYHPEYDYYFNGWRLAGNPYVCNGYVYFADNDNQVVETDFYRMNENGDGYDMISSSDALAPYDGVFVYTENSGYISFSVDPIESRGGKLNMNLTRNGAEIDMARVRFGEGQNLSKMSFREGSSQIYMPVDGKDYASVFNSERQGEVPVSFKAEKNGTYNLVFNSEEVSFDYLHLIDNMTGADVDLLANPSYTFEASTTDYESRFKLVFVTNDGTSTSSETFAFYSNGNWVISNDGNATLQVIDVNGRILKSESINGCANLNINAAPGVYMLRLVNGDNVKVQKVVVR